jgi:transposase
MTRARILQEVRQMRFEELYERRQRRDVTMAEAAEMLGVTERTFRRWSGRYDTEGREGLQDDSRQAGRHGPLPQALRYRDRLAEVFTHDAGRDRSASVNADRSL